MKKLLLLAMLGLAGCKRTTPGALVDPALSTLVPADTTLLVGVRVEDLLKTPIYKKYLADRALAPLDDFSKQFGIDPRKDIWELLYISNGQENVILGRGKFPSEPEQRFPSELQGATRTKYRGYTLIGNEQTALVLIGGSIAAAGDTAGLKRILDTRDKSNGPPPVLAARMKEVPVTAGLWSVYAGSPVSFPANGAPKQGKGKGKGNGKGNGGPGNPALASANLANANLGNVMKVLNSITSGAFYLDLRTQVSGKATGIAPTTAAAKELYDALRGLLGLGRLMGAKDDVKMQRLFDGLRITQDGATVNFYIEEQEDAITTVLDFMTAALGQQRPSAPSAPGPQPLK